VLFNDLIAKFVLPTLLAILVILGRLLLQLIELVFRKHGFQIHVVSFRVTDALVGLPGHGPACEKRLRVFRFRAISQTPTIAA
jgi:hypothetical protein